MQLPLQPEMRVRRTAPAASRPLVPPVKAIETGQGNCQPPFKPYRANSTLSSVMPSLGACASWQGRAAYLLSASSSSYTTISRASSACVRDLPRANSIGMYQRTFHPAPRIPAHSTPRTAHARRRRRHIVDCGLSAAAVALHVFLKAQADFVSGMHDMVCVNRCAVYAHAVRWFSSGLTACAICPSANASHTLSDGRRRIRARRSLTRAYSVLPLLCASNQRMRDAVRCGWIASNAASISASSNTPYTARCRCPSCARTSRPRRTWSIGIAPISGRISRAGCSRSLRVFARSHCQSPALSASIARSVSCAMPDLQRLNTSPVLRPTAGMAAIRLTD